MAETPEMLHLCGRVREYLSRQEYKKSSEEICYAMYLYPHAAEPHNLMGILMEKKLDHVGAMGIALGQALRTIAKECGTIHRYGWCLLPMDGSLARVALDFSGRGGAYWEGEFPTEKCGDFDLELVPEFFRAMAREGGITIHNGLLAVDNSHHASEAVFKGMGMAVKQALAPADSDPSTKGMWL